MTEMGRTHSTYGTVQTCIQWENLRERDLQGSRDAEQEGNIKIDFREVGCDPGEGIDLAEDRDQW